MKVAVFGAGYAGLVSGAGLAHAGHEVSIFDTSSDRIESLQRGHVPFHEPDLSELLRAGLQSGKLQVTSSAAEALDASDVSLVAVGTPSRPDGEIDLSQVLAACRTIGGWLSKAGRRHAVVVKSTVVPGSTEGPIRGALEESSGLSAGSDFGLGMNPEFLREGSAVEDFLHPDRIVLGAIDPATAQALLEMYAGFSCPKIETTPINAELIKYAANSLLSTLVSFSNEWAAVCEDLAGADVATVMAALHLDRRFSMDSDGKRIRPGILSYLAAGPGFGGSCLPKDLSAARAAAQKRGVATPLLDAVGRVNEERPSRVVGILRKELGTLSGSIVAVLGLAFKPGTDDVRDSPALPVIRLLKSEGATCRVWDPMASEQAAGHRRFSPEEALHGADAALLVTSWPEIAAWPWEDLLSRMRRRVIVDSRGLLRSRRWPGDVRYVAIGRGPDHATVTAL
jgi:UDPglucose 6-dehydrogenase